MYYMDVVSVLFFVWFASVPGRQEARLNTWNGCAWFNVLEWCKTYCIYKNVRTCSINVVVAMLWKNAYNTACCKMFQHVNKNVNIIWLKPGATWCGSGLMIQFFNPESRPGLDQISNHPPIFRKFFGLRGTAWGVQKNWVMSVRRGVKSEFSHFVQCTKKIRDIL